MAARRKIQWVFLFFPFSFVHYLHVVLEGHQQIPGLELCWEIADLYHVAVGCKTHNCLINAF